MLFRSWNISSDCISNRSSTVRIHFGLFFATL